MYKETIDAANAIIKCDDCDQEKVRAILHEHRASPWDVARAIDEEIQRLTILSTIACNVNLSPDALSKKILKATKVVRKALGYTNP